MDPSDDSPGFRRSVAVVIGINAYTNGIPLLRTAANDARCLGRLLSKSHGYVVHLLVDEQATGEAILNLLEAKLLGELLPDDRVVFYFAGHGQAIEGPEGPTGYLVPQDARRGDTETYLEMPRLYKALDALPCRHLLAILDSCFAGAFRWSSTRDLAHLPKEIHRERYDRFLADAAWQAIASASHDQEALDALPGSGTFGIRDEPVGSHSPFARALFAALAGAGDLVPSNGGDGVITATELYAYLEQAVQPVTIGAGYRQTPRLWPLAKHDKGEFIFLVPGHELNLPPAPPLTYENNPWRGLKSYEEADAALFFGRDIAIKKLRHTIEAHPLTVVLGASGTGKSSVVRAGLVPVLTHDKERAWRVLPVIRPGATPLATLERATAGLTSETAQEATDAGSPSVQVMAPLSRVEGQPKAGASHPAGRPSQGEGTAHEPSTPPHDRADTQATIEARLAAWADAHPDARLVLVVDQLEELVTMTPTAADREATLALLARLVAAHPERLRVVLTLRSDFEPQFDRSALGPFWGAARYVVPPMTQDEIRTVIEQPASQRVLYFKPAALVDDLINEVVQTPGGLPLLSFALSEMYVHYVGRQSDDRALERVDYEAVGGVVGALRTRAEAEHEALDAASRESMRRVMLRMVAMEGGGIARRRVLKEELEYPDPDETKRVHEVVARLSAARLIVEDGDGDDKPVGNHDEDDKSKDGNSYVEPAHDALVQAWDRLLGWIHAEQGRAADLHFQQRLTRAAQEWAGAESGTVRTGLLWRDSSRGEVLRQQVLREEGTRPAGALPQRLRPRAAPEAGEGVWMNATELAFAKASIRRRSQVRLGLGVLVALIVAGGVVSFIQAGIARQERDTALSRQYAAQSLLATDRDPLEALVLAVAAAETQTVEAEIALHRALAAPRVVAHYDGPWGGMQHIEFDSSGQRFLALGSDGHARVWDVESGERVSDKALPEEPLGYASISPNGRQILTASTRGESIHLWASEDDSDPITLWTGDEPRPYATPTWGGPSGRHILALLPGGAAAVWNADAPRSPPSPIGTEGNTSAHWAQGGQMVLTLGNDGVVRKWSLSTRQSLGTLPALGSVEQVSVKQVFTSPRGDFAFVAYSVLHNGHQTGFEVAVIDISDNFAIHTINLNRSYDVYIRYCGISADLKKIVIDLDTTYIIYDADNNFQEDRYPPEMGYSVWVKNEIHNSENKIISLNPDGRIRINEIINNSLIDALFWETNIIDFAQSPSGSRIATASLDGSVRIWEIGQDIEPFIINELQDDKLAWISRAQFSKDGSMISTMGLTHRDERSMWAVPDRARLWSSETGEEIRLRLDTLERPMYIDLSPDSRLALTINEDSLLRVWNTDTGAPMGQASTDRIRHAAFSPDGAWIVTATMEETVKVVEADTRHPTDGPLGVGIRSEIPVHSVEFSPTGRHLLLLGPYGQLSIWTVRTGDQFVLKADSVSSFPRPARFSPGGFFLATTATSEGPTPANRGAVQIWGVETQREAYVLPGDPQGVQRLDFEPSNSWLLTATFDEVIQIWDWRQQSEISQYRGLAFNKVDYSEGPHVEIANYISVSDSNFRVAIVNNWFNNVHILDYKLGLKIAEIRLTDQPVTGDGLYSDVSFSPDGQLVVTVRDGMARMYNVGFDRLFRLAEERLPTTLTDAERARILGP